MVLQTSFITIPVIQVDKKHSTLYVFVVACDVSEVRNSEHLPTRGFNVPVEAILQLLVSPFILLNFSVVFC